MSDETKWFGNKLRLWGLGVATCVAMYVTGFAISWPPAEWVIERLSNVSVESQPAAPTDPTVVVTP